MKSTFVTLLLVLLGANCAYSLTTQQFVNKFITLYNDQESYDAIVKLFSTKYQAASIKKEIIQNLTAIHDAHGDILTNISFFSFQNTATFLVSFKDDLSAGTLVVLLINKKPQFGMIGVMPNSSFVEYVKQHPENVGFKYIFDDATIKVNDGKYFGAEALQIFPVTVEYCNQVAQGKIKSSKVVSRKDVQKYYIANFDNNVRNFDISQKSSQTLGSLVKQNLQTPSLAVTEYLVDLLGLENIKDTMDSLGISQQRTMYPASYYVQIAAEVAKYKTPQQFFATITDTSDSDITDANVKVHATLKTGSSAAAKMITNTVTLLSTAKNTTRDGINIKNTFATAGGYADAFESFMMKDFSLDGDTKKIYTTFTSLKGSSGSGSSSNLGSNAFTFSGGSLDGTVQYKYGAMGGFSMPSKSSFKSLAYCLLVSGTVMDDEYFQKSYSMFFFNIMLSAKYRSAASDAF